MGFIANSALTKFYSGLIDLVIDASPSFIGLIKNKVITEPYKIDGTF